MLTVDSFLQESICAAAHRHDSLLFIIYSLFFLIPHPGPSPSIKNFPIFFAFPY